MLVSLWHLFVGFFRASNFGFGGGPAFVPLMQVEIVNRFHWLTNAQFVDAVAAANALPGPIGTKVPGYVGYQIAGWPGALVAVFASIGPTVLAVILLGSVLLKFADSPKLKAMLKGVRPVIVVLIAQTSLQMGLTSMSAWMTWVIALATVALLYYTKVHPVVLIVCSMVIGFFVFR
ncbi:chromate transport protein [Peptococcaceae bacterium CEB3]|nr:chromate transport protein [Peptococcaceae bacterium CEB3]